jgi:hypothetical protein
MVEKRVVQHKNFHWLEEEKKPMFSCFAIYEIEKMLEEGSVNLHNQTEQSEDGCICLQ